MLMRCVNVRQVEGLKSMVVLGAKGSNVVLFAQCLTKVLEILATAVDEAEVLSPRRRPLPSRAWLLVRLCVACQHSHSPARPTDELPSVCVCERSRSCVFACVLMNGRGRAGADSGKDESPGW